MQNFINQSPVPGMPDDNQIFQLLFWLKIWSNTLVSVMEIKTKGMTASKKILMDTILFQEKSKNGSSSIFQRSIHALLVSNKTKGICVRHSNSVDEASMLLPKRYFKQFYLNSVFHKKYKNCFRSVSCYSIAIHYIFVNLHNIIAKLLQQTNP